jgi:DHA2 family multidrug resistance protein-like MFS transporter
MSTVAAAGEPRATRRQWAGLAVLALPCLLYSMDLTVLNLAVPRLSAARAVLGVAGATLAPSTLSLIRIMFSDPRQRKLAVAVWITSFSAGGAIGPLLGGVLLRWFWWGFELLSW